MTVSELLRVADHLDPQGQVLVRKAYERAAVAHNGQHRLSGEDYVNHPLEVATILADLELDAETIAAALLHDTVEDTSLTADEVKKEFGPEVARLVEGVTKLGRISLRTDQQQQAAIDYRRTVLKAWREIDDALTGPQQAKALVKFDQLESGA